MQVKAVGLAYLPKQPNPQFLNLYWVCDILSTVNFKRYVKVWRIKEISPWEMSKINGRKFTGNDIKFARESNWNVKVGALLFSSLSPDQSQIRFHLDSLDNLLLFPRKFAGLPAQPHSFVRRSHRRHAKDDVNVVAPAAFFKFWWLRRTFCGSAGPGATT